MKKFKYIIVLFVMGLISFSCTDLDEEILVRLQRITIIKIVIIFMRRW